MTRRDFMEIDPTRQKLIKFIKAAQQGRYYNPMDSVGREAAIETTSLILSEDSLLGALTSEIRELRDVVTSRRTSSENKRKRRHKIRVALGKANRSALWGVAQEIGLSPGLWGRFLATIVPPEMHEEMHGWSIEDWINYLKVKAPELLEGAREENNSASDETPPLAHKIPEDVLEKVENLLPAQPWPTGVHKEVAEQLNLPIKLVSSAIQELIISGKFFHQIDGIVITNSSPRGDNTSPLPAGQSGEA
jgi:hypothetical protein